MDVDFDNLEHYEYRLVNYLLLLLYSSIYHLRNSVNMMAVHAMKLLFIHIPIDTCYLVLGMLFTTNRALTN